jgi:hypothetical protein
VNPTLVFYNFYAENATQKANGLLYIYLNKNRLTRTNKNCIDISCKLYYFETVNFSKKINLEIKEILQIINKSIGCKKLSKKLKTYKNEDLCFQYPITGKINKINITQFDKTFFYTLDNDNFFNSIIYKILDIISFKMPTDKKNEEIQLLKSLNYVD